MIRASVGGDFKNQRSSAPGLCFTSMRREPLIFYAAPIWYCSTGCSDGTSIGIKQEVVLLTWLDDEASQGSVTSSR